MIQIRANRSGNVNGPKTPAEFFNTGAFPGRRAFGNEAPGSLLGPGFQLWDTSLLKKFDFGERVRMQLRFESFNTFNHGSPNAINTSLWDRRPIHSPARLGTPLSVPSRDITIRGRSDRGKN